MNIRTLDAYITQALWTGASGESIQAWLVSDYDFSPPQARAYWAGYITRHYG